MHSFGARNPQLPRVIECQVPVLSSVVKVRPCPPGDTDALSPSGDIAAFVSSGRHCRVAFQGELCSPALLENFIASTSIFVCEYPSYKGPTVDALATGTDEGRGRLRKATGRCLPTFDP